MAIFLVITCIFATCTKQEAVEEIQDNTEDVAEESAEDEETDVVEEQVEKPIEDIDALGTWLIFII